MDRVIKYLKKYIFIGLLIFTAFAGSSLFGDDIKCSYCGENISGKYIILEGENYHKTCYDEHIKPKCAVCGKAIDGPYSYDDKGKYHPECYKQHIQERCGVCGQIIEGTYSYDDKGKYHPACYKNHILPKCSVCKQPLEGEYLIDNWGNAYHPKHKKEKSNCSVCNRILSPSTSKGSVNAGDRVICGYCNETAITSVAQFKLREMRVKYLLSDKAGIRNLPDNIQLILLEKQRDLNKVANMHGDKVKGFTKYEARTLNGRRISRSYKIYILSHLPSVVFDAVLAHELLHVYLFEKQLTLSSPITEGFCNLGSDLVYRKEGSELAKHKLKMMEEDIDPDYGVGYRKMKDRLDKMGWKELLTSLK